MLSSKRDLQFGFYCEYVIDYVAFITYMLVRFEKVIEFGVLESGAVVCPYDNVPITWACDCIYFYEEA